MKIAIGSDNPVKLAAVGNVAGRVFPGAEIVGGKVSSGVSANPADDAEAIAGAKQRARLAREAFSADLGVGLEGGTVTVDGRLMTAGWAAVWDGDRHYVGGGGHLALPPRVAERVGRKGKELGEAMDEFAGGRDTKRKMGAIGILTRGLSDRRRAYQDILAYAFAPLISRRLYRASPLTSAAPAAKKPTAIPRANGDTNINLSAYQRVNVSNADMRIAVGSGNPLKRRAVAELSGRLWPGCRVTGRAVPSGVSANPISNEETISGALGRARAARSSTGSDWGVGLEGGMTMIGGDWFTCVWCVVWDGKEDTRGGGVHFQLPPAVLRGVLEEGREIGACMDELTGILRTKRKMGAEGVLTKGLIDRAAGFASSFLYALAPRLYPYRPDREAPRHAKKKPDSLKA